MKLSPNRPCPCGSGLKYKRCCRPYHRGQPVSTPESLMRARYTAYALHDVGFIIKTTHPAAPTYQSDVAAWGRELQQFCEQTTFVGLTVISVEPDESAQRGWVTFRATLTQNGQDASFSERSRFQKHGQVWTYLSGELGP